LFLDASLEGALDLILIDGDHGYDGVWQDFELALGKSRQGTLIVFHDTKACLGVEKVWLRAIRERLIRPVAEFVAEAMPLGIGVGSVR
jgi:predicted O-methyltransferase YrrM